MIQVAFAADEAYVPHASAMIHSLVAHNPAAETRFHLLHEPALPARARELLAEMVRGLGADIRFHAIPDERVEGLPTMGRISRVMWYRLFLPELLGDAGRVLYVDCDTIVMDNLHALWDTELGTNWLAAVSNVFEPRAERRARALGLDDPADYFNSGVLLLDLEAWRRERCATRILDYSRARPDQLVWPDQDALNVVLARRWHRLHPRWNCQNSLFYMPQARDVFGAAAVHEAIQSPGILHFEGGAFAKPWHYLCKHPFRGEYHRNRARTPWPNVPIEGRTLGNSLLKPLPTRWLLSGSRLLRRARTAVLRRLTHFGARP